MAIVGKVLLRSRGDYTATDIYDVLDWVRYGNKAWVCKKYCQGVTPANGEYWSMMVQDGKESQIMKGASQYTNGESGLVPIPLTTDRGKFLKGDGSWGEVDLSQKANGKGISFEILNGIPYISYEYQDETISTMINDIYDDDPTNDAPQDEDVQLVLNNIYDDDPTNDVAQDDAIDEVINGIYNR